MPTQDKIFTNSRLTIKALTDLVQEHVKALNDPELQKGWQNVQEQLKKCNNLESIEQILTKEQLKEDKKTLPRNPQILRSFESTIY
jgi:vacuolar-type H+-ATPase catalytic subunit A/Vma1